MEQILSDTMYESFVSDVRYAIVDEEGARTRSPKVFRSGEEAEASSVLGHPVIREHAGQPTERYAAPGSDVPRRRAYGSANRSEQVVEAQEESQEGGLDRRKLFAGFTVSKD
jgi:hypothetical protein